MRPFEYVAPLSLSEALQALGKDWQEAKLLAGGMDLLGEMKDDIIAPHRLVNLKGIKDLHYIRFDDGDGLRIGALTTLSEIEVHPIIRERFRALAEAAHSVASVQIRTLGTIGGNLCQRPRCWYYRHPDIRCLKRGGHLCYAYEGENKYHAILGGGPCYIVHPSDCAPALIALKAFVTLLSPKGERTLPLEEFFVLPSRRLDHETVLEPDEILTEVHVPSSPPDTRSTYLKFQEKGSMDFALSGAAVALRMRGDVCVEVRIVLSGVAPIPWRAKEAEAIIKGKPLTPNRLEEAAKAAVAGAKPLAQNAYKVPLTKTVVKRALLRAAGLRE